MRRQRAIQLLDRESIDVVGFQEMHQAQFAKFTEWESDRFGLFPGNKLGAAPMHNSIAWRTAQWRALQADAPGEVLAVTRSSKPERDASLLVLSGENAVLRGEPPSPEGVADVFLRAVSYTHLTLPTKA